MNPFSSNCLFESYGVFANIGPVQKYSHDAYKRLVHEMNDQSYVFERS